MEEEIFRPLLKQWGRFKTVAGGERELGPGFADSRHGGCSLQQSGGVREKRRDEAFDQVLRVTVYQG